MAALIMPDKTDEKVICQESCEHRDCALWRKVFTMKCTICGEEIEAGRAYHEERIAGGGTVSITHEVCELEQMEKQRIESAKAKSGCDFECSFPATDDGCSECEKK